jgi:hypothetical protein
VQAQILSAAGLALRARTEGLTGAAVDRARLRERSVVLTWAMRGTLHLVTAEDLGWLQPSVLRFRMAHSLGRLRQLGVTEDLAGRGTRAIERMLEREGPLTRAEIGQRLRRLGVPTEGQALPHLLWQATSTGRVVHGPDRGRERTFVLVRDWVGAPRERDADSAVGELALRYLRAHGPAVPADLAFWAGIPMAEARRGWAAIADRLMEVEAPGARLWDLRARRGRVPPGIVRLLPSFDEYLLGWKDRAFIADRSRWRRINPGAGWYHPAVVADGHAVATWRMEKRKGGGAVHIEPFDGLSPIVRRSATVDAEDVGRFLGGPLEVDLGVRQR